MTIRGISTKSKPLRCLRGANGDEKGAGVVVDGDDAGIRAGKF